MIKQEGNEDSHGRKRGGNNDGEDGGEFGTPQKKSFMAGKGKKTYFNCLA